MRQNLDEVHCTMHMHCTGHLLCRSWSWSLEGLVPKLSGFLFKSPIYLLSPVLPLCSRLTQDQKCRENVQHFLPVAANPQYTSPSPCLDGQCCDQPTICAAYSSQYLILIQRFRVTVLKLCWKSKTWPNGLMDIYIYVKSPFRKKTICWRKEWSIIVSTFLQSFML